MSWHFKYLNRNSLSIKSWMKGKGMCYGKGERLERRRWEEWSRRGERWSRSISVRLNERRCSELCRLAIQQRRLSTSSRFKLTTINGIFLLSHSIRFPFSRLLLDCPSEAFSIGLLNNATPLPSRIWTCTPHPALHLPPSAAFTSSVPSESSLH